MNGLRHLAGGRAIVAVFALALLLKALVPAGWMPASDHGAITLRLCGGRTLAPEDRSRLQLRYGLTIDHEATAPLSHSGQHDEKRQGGDPSCWFAAASLAWTFADDSPTAQTRLAAAGIVPTVPPGVAIGRGLAAPPPPATGPPILS